MTQLNKSYKIHALAKDLGLRPSADPIPAILGFCERAAHKHLKDFPSCATPGQLQQILAAKLGTKFEQIATDDDLHNIQKDYVGLGESIFATLDADLGPDVFGITYRRRAAKPWEPPYVSVIDARGDKQFRRNYTRWHELGHLFILTDQLRLSFTRTSCSQDVKDPEESLVDVIAGHFAFWPPFFQKHVTGSISFDAIEQVRTAVCPEASKASSLLGIVKLWPSPCILVEGRLALKKSEQAANQQGRFAFRKPPTPALRVSAVTINAAAQKQGFQLHRYWRVPKRSVIYELFTTGEEHATGTEDLAWWEASSGAALDSCRVQVEARRHPDSVLALITPAC
jgi:hypothetical protein